MAPFIIKLLAPALGLYFLASTGDRLIVAGNFADPSRQIKTERVKVVSYNAHHPRGEKLAAIIEHFRNDPDLNGSQIIALQEIDRYRKRVDYKDLPAELARAWGMNYYYAIERFIPEKEGGGDTGVAIMSRFKLSEPEHIALPHGAPDNLPRAALGLTVDLGHDRLRVYTLHIESKISKEKRRDQLLALLDRIGRRPRDEKTIVLGDFNTIGEESQRIIFEGMSRFGFSTPLSDDVPTFVKALIIRLRTDWIFLRNLRSANSGVETELKASDHRPIWVEVELGGAELSRN